MPVKTMRLILSGLDSDHSVDEVVRAINSVPGLVATDVLMEKAEITYDDAVASEEEFKAAIELTGHGAQSA